jgi:hypothetical protein
MRNALHVIGRRSVCRTKFCLRSLLAIVPPKFPDHLIPRMGALHFYAPYLHELLAKLG